MMLPDYSKFKNMVWRDYRFLQARNDLEKNFKFWNTYLKSDFDREVLRILKFLDLTKLEDLLIHLRRKETIKDLNRLGSIERLIEWYNNEIYDSKFHLDYLEVKALTYVAAYWDTFVYVVPHDNTIPYIVKIIKENSNSKIVKKPDPIFMLSITRAASALTAYEGKRFSNNSLIKYRPIKRGFTPI